MKGGIHTLEDTVFVRIIIRSMLIYIANKSPKFLELLCF